MLGVRAPRPRRSGASDVRRARLERSASSSSGGVALPLEAADARARARPARAAAAPRRTARRAAGSAARMRSRRDARPRRPRLRACRAAGAARRDPGSRRRARACTGAAAARGRRSSGPSSTIRPAYMTAIRSAICATTARSCADVDHRELALSARRRSTSSRMRACVTTSRPVVGSSSTTTGGSQTSAERDRHPLLLAARELVRVAARETSGRRRKLRRARATRSTVAPSRRRPAMLASMSAIAVADAQRGIERRARDPAGRTRRRCRAGGAHVRSSRPSSASAADLDAFRRRCALPARA